MTEEIAIRRAESIADYHACQAVQRLAWGITEEGYVVPLATMVGVQLHGGLVLGAFLPSGEAVGMSFAFLGRVGDRVGLYSQLVGIAPGYRSRGIGEGLKQAQREFARAEGLPVIAWAFDPLQSGNAHFNLGKLGASSDRYVVDMYGPRTDALNAGTPTDRLIVEWEVDPPPRPSPPESPLLLPRLISAEDGVGGPSAVTPPPGAPRVLLEIPRDINQIRGRDRGLADAWRQAVRQAFLAAFRAGYRATGFVRPEERGSSGHFYLLELGGR
jgi:predicted GNAT superfamily acetyltransferase